MESDQQIQKFLKILPALYKYYGLPIIVSTHYRLEKKIKKYSTELKNKGILFLRPFSYSDFCHLQLFSKVVLSDSGTITEESSIMDFPAINLRNTHERPEGMEEAIVVMTELNLENIINSIQITTSKVIETDRVKSYEQKNISSKVVKIIASYIDFVNQNVWKKG